MNVRRFSARTSREALRQVREELGVDAVVLSTKPGGAGVEVLAMAPEGMRQVEAMAGDASQPPSPPSRHPERSEGSLRRDEILRFAQDDKSGLVDKGLLDSSVEQDASRLE